MIEGIASHRNRHLSVSPSPSRGFKSVLFLKHRPIGSEVENFNSYTLKISIYTSRSCVLSHLLFQFKFTAIYNSCCVNVGQIINSHSGVEGFQIGKMGT